MDEMNRTPTAPVAHADATGTVTTTERLPARVPWLGVVLYAVIACGLAWLVMLPIWFEGGLASPLTGVLLWAMMATPTVAALIVTFFVVRPERKARYLGLLPFRPVGRKILLFLLWPVVWLALGFAAFFLAAALGWVEPDWMMSTYTAMVGGELAPFALVIMFAVLPLNALISTIPAFGEELGWRGFLTTALAPLGFWPSTLIIGVLWGLWHAPIILLGYNFIRPDVTGLLLMCGFTLFTGIILQWSRVWTGSVWPAAAGHGALNAATSLTFLWMPMNADPATSTLLGFPGWIVMAVLIAVVTAIAVARRGRARTSSTGADA